MKKNGILFRVASGLLAAALTLSLTACGGSSGNSDASVAADSADSGATHLRLIYSPSLCAALAYRLRRFKQQFGRFRGSRFRRNPPASDLLSFSLCRTDVHRDRERLL